MFICAATGKQSQPNEPAHKLVTHVRHKTYTRWNPRKNESEPIGYGTEIVREILVSKEYYAEMMAKGFQPQVVKEKEL